MEKKPSTLIQEENEASERHIENIFKNINFKNNSETS